MLREYPCATGVSAVLTPLCTTHFTVQASNASELIAAYKYAQGKTKKTINISLSTLEVRMSP